MIEEVFKLTAKTLKGKIIKPKVKTNIILFFKLSPLNYMRKN